MQAGEGDDFMKRFGQQLKYFRKKKNLSYRKLAQLCSIDHADLSRMEKGKINIQLLTLLDIANALEIAPHKLLDFKSVNPELL